MDADIEIVEAYARASRTVKFFMRRRSRSMKNEKMKTRKYEK